MSQTEQALSYVLITPARNEAQFIGGTIRSVIAQTRLPGKWVIVSDGSTDRTDEIVRAYLQDHPWIELIRNPESRERNFASKVFAFNTGYRHVQDLDFDVVGCLDADTSFDEGYFAFLMDRFASDPELGCAGTPFVEEGYSSSEDSFEGDKHVAGGIQLFRRTCFEDIGGYIPNPGGCIDWSAVVSARMKGWKTRSFRERHYFHHRSLGKAESSSVEAAFNYGKKDYMMGGHPLWESCRMVYRMGKKPYVLGGASLMCGYLWAWMSRVRRPVPDELVRFHRKEQMEKLKFIFSAYLRFKKIDKYTLTITQR
jgi:glycosyltransferase involved in cell wall biosynthesis